VNVVRLTEFVDVPAAAQKKAFDEERELCGVMVGRRFNDTSGNTWKLQPVEPANFQFARNIVHNGKIFDSRQIVNSLKSSFGCIAV
jgi:hypothetical protein